MSSKREQIEQLSTVVADTGELEAVRRYRPVDTTTNPSLLLAVAGQPGYEQYLVQARELAAELGNPEDPALLSDCFATLMGRTLTELVPGVVSTEVDARLSFDTSATIERARRLAALYRELGVAPDRFLIKVAGTWEGIRAVDVLETEGLRCNVTLVFSPVQARAAAEAGATLVSPFVGRILDWYVKNRGITVNSPAEDPGVDSVDRIHRDLKSHGFDTVVMAASFRNKAQIEALAGCDRLTISPALLEELNEDDAPLERYLSRVEPAAAPVEPPVREADFRWALNQDPMATELLSDGIRRFTRDQQALEELMNGAPDDAQSAG
jgi:transaldolase